MPPRALKPACFVLEAINSLSTTYYFYYLYFFAETKFGFGKQENLLLAAALGVAYAGASMLGGRLAQRRGYLNALGAGCALMGISQALGAGADALLAHYAVMAVAIVGMGMTWPALQALVSEGESRQRLPAMVGVYNLVWSFFGAVAYLTGGAMLESWGLRSIFLVPAVLNAVAVIGVLWLRRVAAAAAAGPSPAGLAPHGDGDRGHGVDAGASSGANRGAGTAHAPPPEAPAFLRMAWFANPFAYLTINTVVAFGPVIARTLDLSPRYAGYFCSVWMFVRTAGFLLFWLWPGWHYRFRWLAAAYAGMIVTFVAILLAPSVGALVAAQLGFGFCIGLIYYSSLFYSMDVGEAKGENGGIHEAAIGLGSAAGPALGAFMLAVAPQIQHGTAKAVGVLLLLGFAGLAWLSPRRRSGGRS